MSNPKKKEKYKPSYSDIDSSGLPFDSSKHKPSYGKPKKGILFYLIAFLLLAMLFLMLILVSLGELSRILNI